MREVWQVKFVLHEVDFRSGGILTGWILCQGFAALIPLRGCEPVLTLRPSLWTVNHVWSKPAVTLPTVYTGTKLYCLVDSQPFRSRANSLPGANRPMGPWPIRSLELSLPGTFVPRSELIRELSLSGTFGILGRPFSTDPSPSFAPGFRRLRQLNKSYLWLLNIVTLCI